MFAFNLSLLVKNLSKKYVTGQNSARFKKPQPTQEGSSIASVGQGNQEIQSVYEDRSHDICRQQKSDMARFQSSKHRAPIPNAPHNLLVIRDQTSGSY